METFVAVILHALSVWVAAMLVLIMVPSMFGFSLGISELYMKILVKTLEWATLRIQRGVKDKQNLQANEQYVSLVPELANRFFAEVYIFQIGPVELSARRLNE